MNPTLALTAKTLRLQARIVLGCIVVLASLPLLGCGSSGGGTVTPPSNAVDHIDIAAANPTAMASQTVQLTATARDAAGNAISLPASNFQWSSSNTSIATVTSSGLVTAIAAGIVQIKVTESSSGKTATLSLPVTIPNTPPSNVVDHVVISSANPNAAPSQTLQLVATAQDVGNNNINLPASNFRWSSSNTAVATVNSTGLVTAIAPGTVQISVTETTSGKTASITFPVNAATRLVLR